MDLDLCHSVKFAALRGRMAEWRAERSRPRPPRRPAAGLEPGIGFRDSLAMHRGVHGRRAA